MDALETLKAVSDSGHVLLDSQQTANSGRSFCRAKRGLRLVRDNQSGDSVVMRER